VELAVVEVVVEEELLLLWAEVEVEKLLLLLWVEVEADSQVALATEPVEEPASKSRLLPVSTLTPALVEV
jgi:hypothetical protein